MSRFDSLYKGYHFSYNSPIMGKFLKRKCYFCKRDLRKVPKDTIVMGEVEWGYEEPPHTERHYWCDKDCVMEWFTQQRTMDLSRGDMEANLNELIKGGGNE